MRQVVFHCHFHVIPRFDGDAKPVLHRPPPHLRPHLRPHPRLHLCPHPRPHLRPHLRPHPNPYTVFTVSLTFAPSPPRSPSGGLRLTHPPNTTHLQGAFAAGRKAILSGDEGAAMLARMKEPYAQSLSAIDDFLGAMRAGTVSNPAAGGAPPGAPGKKAAATAAAVAPKPAAKNKPAAAPKGGEAKAEAKPKADTKPKEHSGVKKEVVKKAAAPAAAERSLDVSFADIRVGKIIDATAHPDSDKLFVETIDLGEAAPRQILSGLGHSMTLDQVKGADVVCICNLKARKLAGIASNGMVLCASDAEKKNLAFVLPPAGSKPGDRVAWAGFEGTPETPKQMDKKKAWEAIQPHFSTDASGTACYKGVPFAVAGGVCTSTITNGIIS